MSMLTQATVNELLHYDPETGVFTWRQRDRRWFELDNACNAWNARFSGKTTGKARRGGYLVVNIFDRPYSAHRLAWLYQTGAWPPDKIDHIDRNPLNNCWANLRPASQTQNRLNSKIPATNTSGFKGVHRHRGKKWIAQININGVLTHLGMFLTPEGAALMRQWATERYHREFAGPLQN